MHIPHVYLHFDNHFGVVGIQPHLGLLFLSQVLSLSLQNIGFVKFSCVVNKVIGFVRHFHLQKNYFKHVFLF